MNFARWAFPDLVASAGPGLKLVCEGVIAPYQNSYSFASAGPNSRFPGMELVGKCGTVTYLHDGKRYKCLVIGCHVDKDKTIHKVYNLKDETTETVNLSTVNWSLVSRSGLPWNPRSLVGQRLWMYWDGEYEDEAVQKKAIEKFGKGNTKIAYEAIVVKLLEPHIYQLLYTCDDGIEIRRLEYDDDYWNIAYEGEIEVEGLPIIGWAGLAQDVVKEEEERPVEERIGAEIIGKCGTVTYPNDGKRYKCLAIGCYVGKKKTVHRVYNLEYATRETLDMSTVNWSLLSRSSLPWSSNGLTGKRLWVYWNGEYEDKSVQKKAIEKFGKGKTKIACEAYVVKYLAPQRYRLLYTCDDLLEDRILDDDSEDWNIVFDYQTEVEGLPIVGWTGPADKETL